MSPARLLLLLTAFSAPVTTAAAVPTCPGRIAAQARERYERLDYDGVVAGTQGLEQCADGTARELADALRWRAQALAADQSEEAATEAFALLATIDPDYVLDPLASPKFHTLFLEGRRRARRDGRIFARLVPVAADGGEVQLGVEVFDPFSRARAINVEVVTGTTRETLPAQRSSGQIWRVPWAPGAKGTWLAIVETEERVAFRTEPADLPRLTPTGTPADVAVAAADTKRSYVPYVVGGALAVAVVATVVVVAIAAKPPPRPTGSLGRLELPLTR